MEQSMAGEEAVTMLNCEREQLHLCQKILSYGVLIACHKSSQADSGWTITHCSDNLDIVTRGRVTARQAIGACLFDVLAASSQPSQEMWKAIMFESEASTTVRRYGPFAASFVNDDSDSVYHGMSFKSSDNIIVLEFDLQSVGHGYVTPERNVLHYIHVFQTTMSTLNDIVRNVATPAEICNRVALLVQRLLGCDRVMAYEFDEVDASGTVIVEHKAAHVASSYQGLRFPASDIPMIARRLFLLNPSRSIPDVADVPVAILPASVPLDLSYSQLRSVSPMHIQYLKNMGVTSSMGFAIEAEDRLWGLISCHHYGEPLYASVYIRSLCETVVGVASATIADKIRSAHLKEDHRSASLIDQLFQGTFTVHGDRDGLYSAWISWLKNSLSVLCSEWQCEALAFSFFGRTEFFGSVSKSDHPQYLRFCSAIAAEQADRERKRQGLLKANVGIGEPFADSSFRVTLDSPLRSLELSTSAPRRRIAGYLYVPLQPNHTVYLVAFRVERIHTVNWLGKPDKVLDAGTQTLHPRFSFEAYAELVSNQSLRFTAQDLSFASFLQRRASQRLSSLLLAAEEQSALVSTYTSHFAVETQRMRSLLLSHVSHELRTPFVAIVSSLDEMLENGEGEFSVECLRSLRSAHSSAKMALRMTDDILKFLDLEGKNVELQIADCGVVNLLEEVFSLLGAAADRGGVSMELMVQPEFPMCVASDAELLRQLFLHIIGNAVKFSSKGSTVVVNAQFKAASDIEPSPMLTILVHDDGEGIDPETVTSVLQGRVWRPSVDSRSHLHPGAGVGLSISHHIVQRLGGMLEIDSTKGEGTDVSIHLPVTLTESNSAVDFSPRTYDQRFAQLATKFASVFQRATRCIIFQSDSPSLFFLLRRLPWAVAQVSNVGDLEKILGSHAVLMLDDAVMSNLSSADGQILQRLLSSPAWVNSLSVVLVRSRHLAKLCQAGPVEPLGKEYREVYVADLLPLVEAGFPVSILELSEHVAKKVSAIGKCNEYLDDLRVGTVTHLDTPVTSNRIQSMLAELSAKFASGTQAVSAHERAQAMSDAVVNILTPPAESPALASENRVLVVEDNPTNARVLCALLRKSNISFDCASNGAEAVTLYVCQRGRYALILMDLFMPVLDGFEAARRIRQFEREADLPRTRIVALTADVMTDTREKCMDVGMDKFCNKPIPRDLLKQLLEDMSQPKGMATN
jgi:light-regulated signal transduction histidine kinase (bacteriophytochrome)/ActR/RegA family two-component response regulator